MEAHRSDESKTRVQFSVGVLLLPVPNIFASSSTIFSSFMHYLAYFDIVANAVDPMVYW